MWYTKEYTYISDRHASSSFYIHKMTKSFLMSEKAKVSGVRIHTSKSDSP